MHFGGMAASPSNITFYEHILFCGKLLGNVTNRYKTQNNLKSVKITYSKCESTLNSNDIITMS